MNNKKILVNFLLAAIIVAGLIVSPIQRQAARATVFRVDWMNNKVTLTPITQPPKVMCIGDQAPISYSYKSWSNVISVNAKTGGSNNSGVPGGLIAVIVKGGTLSQSSWPLNSSTGSGVISTTFTATQKGDGQIGISGKGNFDVSGGDSIGPFTIQECSMTIALAASNIQTESDTLYDNSISGKGGIKIDWANDGLSGTVTGGGTYQYRLSVAFKPPVSTMTCDKYLTSIKDSTFNVTGNATKLAVIITIDFEPFDFKPLNVHCKDTNGTDLYVNLAPAKHVDLNKDWDLGVLTFSKAVPYIDFPFGEGGNGRVWLIKRKGGKK